LVYQIFVRNSWPKKRVALTEKIIEEKSAERLTKGDVPGKLELGLIC
jgi:hypothetical protein